MAEQASEKTECGGFDSSPTEAHKRFEPFVGTFAAEVKMWMGPGDPMTVTGIMENKLDLDGRFLHQHYTGDPCDGPFGSFKGRGYWGYNTVTNKYEGFWIDTACTFMQTESGEVDASGKAWTMVGEIIDPQNKQPMKKRSLIKLEDSNHHSMEMYFQGPDGNEFKSMEIKYVRKG